MADSAELPTAPAASPNDAKQPTATQATAAVDRLPDEIIEQVLRITDPDGFASLIILNRQWRRVSQQAHLYAHQLLRCPSYATSHTALPSANDDDLPKLRRLFALEVKRNLLRPFMRPRETTIKLISTSISSSSCPGGEGMQFSASAKGHHLLAYNSSRLHVLDVRGPELEVKREFMLRRRPVSATITDDATTLAVLSTEMQLNLYDLTEKPPRRKHAIILDKNPRAMAISSCASVLAAAYDTGIEVSSLRPDALPTDRREVKCDAVDALAFSYDGTQILGTTLHSSPPTTVVLTAPYYDPGTTAEQDNLSSMWTTSILFPNTTHDCSHAILIQNGTEEEAAWAFTYDQSFETFRAIRIDDLRNGTTYFTGPAPKAASQAKLLPCTLPAATYHGQLVAAGFHRNEVWVYGVPEDLDAVPGNSLSSHDAPAGLGRNDSSRSNLSRHGSGRGTEATGERLPQWKLLCDKLRNNFVAGRKVSELTGLSNVKWVEGFGGSSSKERLVITSRGVSAPRVVTDEEDIDFVDGGRVSIIDLDYGMADGTKREVTIEVGTDHAEELKEEKRDMATEVAIVRRRTVAQNRSGRNALLRAATTAGQSNTLPPLPRHATAEDNDDPLVPRRVGRNPTTIEDAEGESIASVEEMEALDAPYAHASPRSGTTLRRAATAAAVNRRLNPRTADGRRIEYRRADGRGELPHESDADNWVPPPPPYQPDDPGAVPIFLRRPAVAPLPLPARPVTGQGQQSTAPWQTSPHAWPGTFAPNPTEGSRRQSRQRTASDSTTYSRQRPEEIPRPLSTPSLLPDSEDLYGVSPPTSPRLQAAESSPSSQASVVAETGAGAGAQSATPAGETMPRVSDETTNVQPDMAATKSTAARPTSNAEREVPTLNVEIPTSHLSVVAPPEPQIHQRSLSNAQTWPRAPQTLAASAEEQPVHVRRLSNAQTWPLAPQQQPDADRRDFSTNSQDMPAMDESANADEASPLPPPPSSAQIERLNKRISRGHPRRLSGGIPTHWSVAGSRRSGSSSAHLQRKPVASPATSFEPSIVNPDEEQPLIISTPKGVSGAFDGPASQVADNETPILAPIPRRPRHNITYDPQTPPDQQIATIFNPPPGIQEYDAPQSQQKPRGLPSWLTSPPSSSSRSSLGLNRRPSRAERSAAKNMQDARKRGWKPKSKKDKNENSPQEPGWTNVQVNNQPKDGKKCIVM
ncbi:hypothetical protein K4F52_005863 [Lecanicillium sp. MT-2017a]|nr:hypothetical protein K4F52_005863 [Lecanicillium sp. MT-2017a]